MNENPYNSPSDVAYEATGSDDVFIGDRPRRRPVGVSILAALHILIGIAQFAQIAALASLSRRLGTDNLPESFLIMAMANAVLLGSIWLVSGVGMWNGAKWGWWTGAFCHAFGVLRTGVTVLAFTLLSGPRGPLGSWFILSGAAIPLLIQSALVFYFFKTNVFEFFGLEGVGKFKAVGILFGVSLAIIVAFVLVPRIIGSGQLM